MIFISYNDIHQQAKQWVRLFLSADCEGYWANNVTPYMHILVYHIPYFIREYGNIKKFSCQGVEKNNDTSKVAFFRKSNKWDGCVDILSSEYKLDTLKYCERLKEKHTKRKLKYWYGHEIQESRSKRARIGHYIPDKQIQKTSLSIIKKYKIQHKVRKIKTQKLKGTTSSDLNHNQQVSESSTSETIDDVTSVFATSNEINLLNSFLNEQQRKVNSVLGDGNCLFRALSKALSGLEDYHPHIREAISEFEETNRNLFEPIHNSIIGTEFDNHVKNMKKLSTWGTTTEIIGAATLFQLDIYLATNNYKPGIPTWLLYTPKPVTFLDNSNTNVLTKHNIENMQSGRQWIELTHVSLIHFDCIEPLTGCNLSRPRLEGSTSSFTNII